MQPFILDLDFWFNNNHVDHTLGKLYQMYAESNVTLPVFVTH